METESPPPYHEAPNSGPPVQNDGYPIQRANTYPGPNGVGFGQVPYPVNPPPVTTQPVVTPNGVIVEESVAPPVAALGTAAATPHDGKNKRRRRDRTCGWCAWCYCGPGCNCGNCNIN
ncbi:hypothetical protein Bbelb_402310 [Branchiostoma belcheri]|nr:hypothetical protein Bbelb_402310 [Branchiostoma belcheri]